MPTAIRSSAARPRTNPFVFYNVISGNGGNGLRVTNSNDTTIQANFIGIGADNLTAVGNALNGVLVEGSSTNTTMGGPIPLGNVDAANGQNGIVVAGHGQLLHHLQHLLRPGRLRNLHRTWATTATAC